MKFTATLAIISVLIVCVLGFPVQVLLDCFHVSQHTEPLVLQEREPDAKAMTNLEVCCYFILLEYSHLISIDL